MPKYLLGTDNGGTVAKAALVTLDGREVAAAGRKTETLSPQPGHAERDMDALWEATAESIREVLRQAGASADDVLAVAAAGHGNGLYLVDDEGQPAAPGIYSTDTRAKDVVARWQAEGAGRKVHPHTMQSLWPGQPGPILAWLREHQPEVVRHARWVLMCKDFIRLRLCGRVAAELTDMSGTSLMSVRDGDYSHEVLEAFGLDDLRQMLPPIRRPEEICGRVTAQAAAQTGLKEGTPVAAGLFDVDACALAAGIVDESRLSVVAGTWSVNQYVSTEPVADETIFMTTRYCVPGYYLMLEASATSASNLEWFVSRFIEGDEAPGQAGETAKAPGAAEPSAASAYEQCNALVAATRPDEAGIVFLPFLFGSNADPDAKACLVGLTGRHTKGHVMRAVYEGVVFGHKAHVDRLLRFREPPETVRLTGGAARSNVWAQMFADVLGVPVEVPIGTELGAKGAAMCAGVAAGSFADYAAAVEAMVHVDRVFQPDAAVGEVYQTKYRRYRSVVETLSPVWQKMAEPLVAQGT